MTEDRAAVVERLTARRDELVGALAAFGEAAAPPELAAVDPCLLVPCPGPSEEGARAFVVGVLAWLRERTFRELQAWLESEERGGLLAFCLQLWEVLPRLAGETAPEGAGEDDAAWVRARLGELVPSLSLVADAHLTRAHECVPLYWQHLEAMHRLASPLAVCSIALDWASGALESGDREEAARRIASCIAACQTMAGIRASVSERTPVWAQALRRALTARDETPA